VEASGSFSFRPGFLKRVGEKNFGEVDESMMKEKKKMLI